METITEAVTRLYLEEHSQREIAAKLNISHKKVLQILVTEGCIETAESKLFASGKTPEEIAEILGKKLHSVVGRIPYQKGMYNSENPTENALSIRKHRKQEESQND